MFCHKCGSQVSPDLQFCPNCGQSLAAPVSPSPGMASAWTPPAGVKAQTGHWIGQGWNMVKADMGIFLRSESSSSS